MDPTAAALIDRLQLAPHPEGGYFREIHRSRAHVRSEDERPRRSAVTTIYYLLVSGQHSGWHRVRSDEIWHFYRGDPLELFVAPPSWQPIERIVLGPPLAAADGGATYSYTVPADRWQAARPIGAFTLAGCTVAPGFEFTDFTLLRDAPSEQGALARLDREMLALL